MKATKLGVPLTIWESIIEFLEGLIKQFGLPKLILAFCGVLGALVGVGFAVEPETQIRVVGISIIVLLLLVCLALFIDRRELRNTMLDETEILNRYGDEIVGRQTTGSFDIKDWRDEQHIENKKGDTTICRRFTLVVRNQPLQTFWHSMEMTAQGADLKYQKKVEIETRTFDAQTLQPGVNYLFTPRWNHHALRVFIHLDRAYAPGEEVYVYLRVVWPQFNKHTIENRQGDTAEWMLRRNVEKLHVSYTFAEKTGIKQDFNLHPLPSSPRPMQTRVANTLKIDFDYPNPPKDTAIGFIIQRSV